MLRFDNQHSKKHHAFRFCWLSKSGIVTLPPRYPVILSIENHCTVPQQKKMAEYLREVLQDKLDLSSVNVHECKRLPSPEILKGKVLVKVRLLLVTHDVLLRAELKGHKVKAVNIK